MRAHCNWWRGVKLRVREVRVNGMPVALSFVAAATPSSQARCACKLKVGSNSNPSLNVATCVRFEIRLL